MKLRIWLSANLEHDVDFPDDVELDGNKLTVVCGDYIIGYGGILQLYRDRINSSHKPFLVIKDWYWFEVELTTPEDNSLEYHKSIETKRVI